MEKKRPKLLFLVQLPPPIHGASLMNSYIKNSEFISREFDCAFINISGAKEVADVGKFKIRKLINGIKIFLKLLFQILYNRPDLVYLTLSPHGIAFYKDSILAQFCKLLRVEIVYHLHGKGITNRIEGRLSNYIYKLVFRKANIILLSPLLEYDIAQIRDKRKKLFFLPNGIPDNYSPIKKNRDVPAILFLSNIGVAKGAFSLVEALQRLQDKTIDFKANFVGSGTASTSITDFRTHVASLNLNGLVNVVGPKYSNDKHSYLADSSLLVFPTKYKNECFPLVVLEALQFGLPVISTREGAISEIVTQDTGILVNADDAEELAKAIYKLLENPKMLLKMSQAARNRYLEKYTLDAFICNLTEILKNILSNERTD